MPKFDPRVVIEDMQGRAVRTGVVDDPVDRGRLAKLRADLAGAPPEAKPALEEALMSASTEAQAKLTVGGAVVASLTTGLPGDEQLPGVKKLDFYEWAIKIKLAENVVEFDHATVEAIKERVARCYPSPMVVGQVFKAITSD